MYFRFTLCTTVYSLHSQLPASGNRQKNCFFFLIRHIYHSTGHLLFPVLGFLCFLFFILYLRCIMAEYRARDMPPEKQFMAVFQDFGDNLSLFSRAVPLCSYRRNLVKERRKLRTDRPPLLCLSITRLSVLRSHLEQQLTVS